MVTSQYGKKMFLGAVFVLAFVFASPSATYAGPLDNGNDPFPPGSGGTSGDPKTFSAGIGEVGRVATSGGLSDKKSAKEILQSIVKWLLSLIGTFAVISLLYGGYLYITSQGEERKAEQAKTIILYSVIGLIIIGLSAVVVNVVISVATG